MCFLPVQIVIGTLATTIIALYMIYYWWNLNRELFCYLSGKPVSYLKVRIAGCSTHPTFQIIKNNKLLVFYNILK